MMSRSTLSAAALAVCAGGAVALAQPTGAPVYTVTIQDAVTGDNAFLDGSFRFWTVDAGADSYQNDIYERPTAGTFQLVGPTGAQRYAASEYLAYVDIENARFGYDSRFVYVAIDVVGRDKRTQDGVNTIEGLQSRYGFRFGADPDGRNSTYFIVDQPESASLPNTTWTNLKTEAFRDTDRDVGGRGGPIHGNPGPSGLSVTKSDNILEEEGLNGYDQLFIGGDGRLFGVDPIVLWQRISPTDNTVVEIAFDYLTAGLTQADLAAIQYLHFEANLGGPNDPGSGLWNDKFRNEEAGSPNQGIGDISEFGTQGLVELVMIDTVRGSAGSPPPPPPPPVCPADISGDGFVDATDLFAFLNLWFAQAGPCTGACQADFNGSGTVDSTDLFAYLNAWFAGLGPC